MYEAIVFFGAFFQAGGSNKSCDGNLEVTAFGKTIKLSSLRKSLSDCRCKNGERKLARSLGSTIASLSVPFNLPGNLSKKIGRMYPQRNFTLEEQVWQSDFQVDNRDCPEETRRFINESFDQRKLTKNQNSNSTPTKQKKTGK